MGNELKNKEGLYQSITEKKANEIILINDPIFTLISDLPDINNIESNKYYTKFLYPNKSNIHKNLYDNEEFIIIKEDKKNHNLTFYFYLNILIITDKDNITYKYTFDFIKEMFIRTKNSNSEKIKQLIISKIILEFIENYEQLEEAEDPGEIINEIKTFCNKNLSNLNNNLNFEKLDLSKIDIKNNNIDEIYIQIIIILFENNNFENDDDIINILNELSLETINLTETMFDKLSKFLNKKENIKKFEISHKDDLFKKEKINFYFILFKYILKHSFYIYNNTFLLKTKKNIISFIKSDSSLSINDIIDKSKLKYILNAFLDSPYYINYIIESNKKKLPEKEKSFDLNTTPSYYSKRDIFFSHSSRQFSEHSGRHFDYDYDYDYNNNDDNSKIRDIKNEIWYKLLKKSSFEIVIIKSEIFTYKYKKIKYNDSNEYKTITYEEFLKIKDNNNSIYFNNFNLFKNFLQQLKDKFKKEINNNIKINIEIKFEIKEYNNDIFKIDCDYILMVKDDKFMFRDSDILNKGVVEGFEYLLNEIEEYKENIYDSISDNDDDNYSVINNDDNFSVIKLVKIIENPDKSNVQFIKELSNGFCIYGSDDHKLIIYNRLFEPIIKINEFNDLISFNCVYSICEICEINPSQKKENEIQLFICLGTHLILIKIDFNNFTYNFFIKKLEKMYWVQCIETKNNNYIFFGPKGAHHLNEIPSKIIENNNYIIYSINDTKYINGIKIDENIVSLSSNNVYENGEDKICFYNSNKKTITHEIKGLSFTNSLNGLSLMNINKNNNNSKILLCACRKYNKNQKNGILLIEPLLKDNKEIYHFFYEADFEVQCLCPIIYIEKENNNIINENINSFDTSYFLAGGLDEEKRIGTIKLFKVIFDKQDYHYKVEFISEVEEDSDDKDFDGFKAINNITQSKETGDILITCCEDSNIYIFKFHKLDV